MGDPCGNWDNLEWTAEKLWNEGISLLPLDGNGKPLTNWRDSLESDVSRLPLEEVVEWIRKGAKGLAIAMGSSMNGDLWCRTFDYWQDYMTSLALMGQNAKPLACAFKEGGKTHVLFLIDDKSVLDPLEETGSGKYLIEYPAGMVRGRHSLLRIPPGDDLKWIQEPVINLAKPNVSNFQYYNAATVGLLPPF